MKHIVKSFIIFIMIITIIICISSHNPVVNSLLQMFYGHWICEEVLCVCACVCACADKDENLETRLVQQKFF